MTILVSAGVYAIYSAAHGSALAVSLTCIGLVSVVGLSSAVASPRR